VGKEKLSEDHLNLMKELLWAISNAIRSRKYLHTPQLLKFEILEDSILVLFRLPLRKLPEEEREE